MPPRYENDDNDAFSRFMWPSRFMSAFHGPRRDELSSLFRNPFSKRAARGHLRFVKRKYLILIDFIGIESEYIGFSF